jgi:glutamate dehydrogenase
MLIGGSMINRMGPFFVLRTEEETGASVAQIARAYAIVRDLFDVRGLWRGIEALDYKVEASVQYDSIFEIGRMVRRAVYWLLQNYSGELDIEPMVARFRPGVLKVRDALPAIAVGRSADAYTSDSVRYAQRGLPPALAQHIAALRLMTQILDVIELAREFRLSVIEVGKLYFALAHELKLDAIREQIESLVVDGRWRATARAMLRETLAHHQRALLRSALAAHGDRNVSDALAAWLERHKAEVARVQRTLDDMQSAGRLDFAMLSVALNEVARLV